MLIEQQVRLTSAVREREEVLARHPVPAEFESPWNRAREKAEGVFSDAGR
jgi:hypothetical protein